MNRLSHQFVEFIPEVLQDGVLYISLPYGTVCHRCCCGCGHEIVTPLTPTDWKLTFDGETISLWPSVGNWDFPCRSHYVIRNSRVEWAEDWSERDIDAAIAEDQIQKNRYYGGSEAVSLPEQIMDDLPTKDPFWSRFWRRWFPDS